jgi:hypothetical protein
LILSAVASHLVLTGISTSVILSPPRASRRRHGHQLSPFSPIAWVTAMLVCTIFLLEAAL